MNYSNILKEIRATKKLTQQDIADILNIERGTYKDYENQTAMIPIKHLITLSNYYEITIDYLLGLTSNNQYTLNTKIIDKKTSGLRIRTLRKDLKYNQTTFASLFNTSYGTISGYEKGRYIIATPFLYQICKKYQVSAEYLLGRCDNKNLT